MITLIHGGQSGVDRGAHETAIDNKWLVSGYMPSDGRDKFGPIPPDVAKHLRPCEKSGYGARTEANVQNSDALLVVVPDRKSATVTPGTAKTIGLAEDRRVRTLIVDPAYPVNAIASWIWHDLLAFHTLPLPLEFSTAPKETRK